jgi:putative membrane protein
MSELRTRRPAVFRFDDPAVVAAAPVAVPPAEVPSPPEPKRRRPWAAMFWIGAFGLAVLATGLGIVNLIEDLASRAAWLGGVGVVLAAVAGVALAAIVVREAIGLARLDAIESLHNRAAAILASDERAAGRALVPRSPRPDPAHAAAGPSRGRGSRTISATSSTAATSMRLAERELMAPLDDEARRLVGRRREARLGGDGGEPARRHRRAVRAGQPRSAWCAGWRCSMAGGPARIGLHRGWCVTCGVAPRA